MKYTTLFTIEILHDYFESGRAGDIQFTPTAACRQRLQGLKAFTKSWQNKLYVIVPTTDGTRPAVALPAAETFEFFWQPTDSQFFNYTQLPIGPGQRYYCHNEVAAVRAGKNYLHALPAAHQPANAYSAGSMVSSASQHCFEALANVAGGNGLDNGQQWVNRGEVAYLSASQLVNCTGSIPILPVSPAAPSVQVRVYGWKPGSNFPNTLLLNTTILHASAVQEQAIDLRGFAAGMYRILVNGQEHFCYLDPAESWQQQVGIISIYHHATLPAPYALADGTGQLLHPVYSIRLAPPQVIWQYKARTLAVKKITDEAGIFQFDATPPLFTSQLPIRLQQVPYGKMMLEYNNTSPPDPLKTVVIKKLPAGSPMVFSGITKNSTPYLMATILLNY